MTTTWHYFDRAGEGILCDPCGTNRWGEGDEGFNARYDDETGDWCATFWLAGEQACVSCGSVVR